MTFDPATLKRDYGDALREAQSCRQSAALFDFSFVSRARVSGPGALAAVQRLVARPLQRLEPGRIAYALRENEAGNVVSDLTVWRTADETYELMSGRGEDIEDLVASPRDCTSETLSSDTAILALQGPASLRILLGLGGQEDLRQLGYFGFAPAKIAGIDCCVGRLGYTGEPGFEIVAARSNGAALWQALSAVAQPAGFAAADILRIEAGFILFCNELRLPVTAGELRLTQFAPSRHSERPDACRLVSFVGRCETPLLWRPRKPLMRPCERGTIVATSACPSPLVQGTLGLGFALEVDAAEPGARLWSEELGEVEIVPHPYFDTGKQRPRRPWTA